MLAKNALPKRPHSFVKSSKLYPVTSLLWWPKVCGRVHFVALTIDIRLFMKAKKLTGEAEMPMV